MSATLKAVSFKTPVQPLPRLSKRRAPGEPWHERYWTEKEIAIVRTHFPIGGANACLPFLPKRTRTSIFQISHKLGLKSPKSTDPKQRHEYGPEMDERIREAWPSLKGRGAVNALADTLSVPRWWLSKQACKLGLAKPHQKEPPWTDAEIALMKEVPLHDPHRCAKIFREHGYRRTATAIMVKAKRLDLSRRYRETLSATAACRILGVDQKWITARCIAGELKAEKRETKRLPQQGGDPWSIRRADLRAYILANLEQIDIRKVEKFAFVELISIKGIGT